MARLTMTGKLLKWGNSYGVRIAKADVQRAGLQIGDELSIVTAKPGKVDISHIRTFRSGDPYGSRDHDEILYEAQLEKMLRNGNIDRVEFDKEVAKIRRIIKRRGTHVER